jgi:large subunit ribosomal protein L2
MALRKYKPTTAGTRWRIGNAYEEVTTNVPEKSLLEKQKSTAGRNAQGRRSMRYMGSGNKTMYEAVMSTDTQTPLIELVRAIERELLGE